METMSRTVINSEGLPLLTTRIVVSRRTLVSTVEGGIHKGLVDGKHAVLHTRDRRPWRTTRRSDDPLWSNRCIRSTAVIEYYDIGIVGVAQRLP